MARAKIADVRFANASGRSGLVTIAEPIVGPYSARHPLQLNLSGTEPRNLQPHSNGYRNGHLQADCNFDGYSLL